MAIYSVTQVAGYLSDLLYQDSALQDLWVSGEVANLARPGSGNSYFTLRDSGSTLRCAMFSRSSRGAELLAGGACPMCRSEIEASLLIALIHGLGTAVLVGHQTAESAYSSFDHYLDRLASEIQ